jgi:hypothetical protein
MRNRGPHAYINREEPSVIIRNKTRMRTMSFALAALAMIALASCSNPAAPSAARVQFRLDSPFCGPQKFALRFSIDSAVVGTDSLSTGQSSPIFLATPGTHHLVGVGIGVTATEGDTTVTLKADSTFTAVVNIYCS